MATTLILFDVDGTLTEPRIKIKEDMIENLTSLKLITNLDIGIVGGSNLEKQKEQLGEEILSLFDYVFSENGLMAFHKDKLFHENSIAEFLGEENIKKLINTSLAYMATIDIPVKRGTFIEFRTGMINLCPVGRSCNQKERDQFFEYDKIHNIRGKMVDYLNEELKDLNLSFSIGGQISIDVFPKGWDKTYCLQFIKEKYERIVFFGDKTMKGGNDYEIFEHPLTESYTVTSPKDTIRLLDLLF
jgi:phosphomannomutase